MASQRSDAARCAMVSAAGVGAVVLTAHGCNQLVFVPSTAGETSLRGSLASGSRPGQVAQRGAVHKGMTSDMAAVSAALGLCGASALAVMAKRRRFNSRCVELYVSSPEQPKSLAIPFAPVPSNLTNNPLDKVFPGDLGFDPLGMSTYEGKYVDEVLQNFDATFDRMRWYREAELMHGRVAMLASLNLLLRETALSPILPDQLLEAEALTQLVQTMAMLEAYRGWRLFFNTDQIAGDLGLGSLQGPSAEELALRQYKELQNGRLAMVAIVAMAAQYQATGRAVGIDESQVQQQVQMVGNYLVGLASIPGQQQEAFEQAWPFLLGLLGIDGIRRLSTPSQDKAENEIAQKSLNIAKLSFGVQDPALSLPAGVSAGQAPQTLSLTEEQVVEFEDNGVIIIRGAMKEWVNFLQKTTEHQIENPHIWSLVGRMSGLYDYIQRNTWMTNNGFRDFIYYSPLGHIISQLGRTEEVRVTTDMLLVNPNRGFGWHQDNQNGPIDFPNAIRWWVAMDKCGENDYGAPEYILGSHRNATVSDDAVFVEREAGDLGSYQKTAKYVCQPGDLIIWDARTIHRIIAPPGQCWEEGTQRRAIGGTVAKAGARYFNKGGASSISDLAGHEQQNGDMLGGPYFPRIWPNRVPEEAEVREQGRILGRSPKKMLELASTLAANAGKYVSFTKVLGKRA